MRQSSQCAAVVANVCVCFGSAVPDALADETCNSPYISNLIKGQEDFVHVWTLGVEGLGDGHGARVQTPGDRERMDRCGGVVPQQDADGGLERILRTAPPPGGGR